MRLNVDFQRCNIDHISGFNFRKKKWVYYIGYFSYLKLNLKGLIKIFEFAFEHK
jgi:hypothetical protein